MGARGQSPFGSKLCPGYRIVPVPEYATDITALAPIALSAACRRLAASCAAAGLINAVDAKSSVPRWVLILLLPTIGPGRPPGRLMPNPAKARSRDTRVPSASDRLTEEAACVK